MSNLTINNVPDEVAKGLIEAYPDKKEREKVVNTEIINALVKLTKAHKKTKFFDVLDNFTPFPKQDKSSIEMIREIREAESNRLLDYE